MNFSIVIPIYNEADNVKSLVDEIYYVFKNNNKNASSFKLQASRFELSNPLNATVAGGWGL